MRRGRRLLHLGGVLGLLAGLAVLGAQSALAAGRGQVGAWGYNQYGQVGDGSTTDQLTPVRVHGSHGVGAIAIDAGEDHSLALKSDGTVWARGLNGSGQLGDGTRGDPGCYFCRRTAVQILNLSGVTAISAGGNHNLTLKRDGTAWAWGRDDDGQVGDGTRGDPACSCRTTAVQVHNVSRVTALSAGCFHSLALASDGTVWAWGYDSDGQLGDGTQGDSSCFCRTVPVQVRVLSGVTAVSAGGGIFGGGAHSLALSNDGTVWAWGYDYHGELGDGTRGISPCFCQTTPVQTQRLADVTAISAGGQHSLALRLGT